MTDPSNPYATPAASVDVAKASTAEPFLQRLLGILIALACVFPVMLVVVGHVIGLYELDEVVLLHRDTVPFAANAIGGVLLALRLKASLAMFGVTVLWLIVRVLRTQVLDTLWWDWTIDVPMIAGLAFGVLLLWQKRLR